MTPQLAFSVHAVALCATHCTENGFGGGGAIRVRRAHAVNPSR
jgi:hypothetical protein